MKLPHLEVDPHDKLLFRGIKNMHNSKLNITNFIASKGTKFLCIQDDIELSDNIDLHNNYIHNFYQSFYPDPSPFEIV